jgi:hypothetical protein
MVIQTSTDKRAWQGDPNFIIQNMHQICSVLKSILVQAYNFKFLWSESEFPHDPRTRVGSAYTDPHALAIYSSIITVTSKVACV